MHTVAPAALGEEVEHRVLSLGDGGRFGIVFAQPVQQGGDLLRRLNGVGQASGVDIQVPAEREQAVSQFLRHIQIAFVDEPGISAEIRAAPPRDAVDRTHPGGVRLGELHECQGVGPPALPPGQKGVVHQGHAALLRLRHRDEIGGIDAAAHRPHVVDDDGVFRTGSREHDGEKEDSGRYAPPCGFLKRLVIHGLPHAVLVVRQGGPPQVQPPRVVRRDPQHRPPGVAQGPRAGQVGLLRRPHVGDAAPLKGPVQLGKIVGAAADNTMELLLRPQRPLGPGVVLPGKGQGDAGQHRRRAGQRYQAKRPPPGGRGPFAQVGEQHGAPAGAQRQEGQPVWVVVGQQAGEQRGQGEQRRRPPPPGPHHRPAQGQRQRGQRQDEKECRRGLLLAPGEAGVVLEHPALPYPLGEQNGDGVEGEPRPLNQPGPVQRPGQNQDRPQSSHGSGPQLGQRPGPQGQQGEKPRQKQEAVCMGGAQIQGTGGVDGVSPVLRAAVQGQKRAGEAPQGAQQQQPVRRRGQQGTPFPVSHRRRLPPM